MLLQVRLADSSHAQIRYFRRWSVQTMLASRRIHDVGRLRSPAVRCLEVVAVSAFSSMEPLASANDPVCDWVPAMDSIYRLSVEPYQAMVAAGVFKKRDRLELINGFLVSKITALPPHAVASTMLWEGLKPVLLRTSRSCSRRRPLPGGARLMSW